MKKICIVCLSLLFVACTKENSAEQPLSTYSPVQFIYNEEMKYHEYSWYFFSLEKREILCFNLLFLNNWGINVKKEGINGRKN